MWLFTTESYVGASARALSMAVLEEISKTMWLVAEQADN
jgi:hypothetical protein